MTSRLGIIGHPIGHSISPVFQQAALDHLGIDATYQAWEVAPVDVGGFVGGLREPGTLGINVTLPHKEAVMPFLDEVDDWATAAGAVNTIVNRQVNGQPRLTGHNTDGTGFLRALREETGFTAQGRRILVLGAGGAARGVVLALSRESAAGLIIANRTVSRAHLLAQLAADNGIESAAIPLTGHELDTAVQSADLIVNCTTMGMAHGPAEGGSPLDSTQIPSTVLINDLVYNPRETPLLREARLAGAQTLGGIHMLVYQGAASFEMWTGQPAPVSVMLEAALRAMESRS
ncbi:MAG: shikimate dehydrogenase [Chloroflexi bacterium]|nr:shikimate dehydrogenase [Chloroflexota bacterium]